MDIKSEANEINERIITTMKEHNWAKVNVIISSEMYHQLQEHLLQSINIRYFPYPLNIRTNKYYIIEDVEWNYISLDDLEFKVTEKEIYTPYCRYDSVELMDKGYIGKIKL